MTRMWAAQGIFAGSELRPGQLAEAIDALPGAGPAQHPGGPAARVERHRGVGAALRASSSVDVPDTPFPRLNDSKMFVDRLIDGALIVLKEWREHGGVEEPAAASPLSGPAPGRPKRQASRTLAAPPSRSAAAAALRQVGWSAIASTWPRRPRGRPPGRASRPRTAARGCRRALARLDVQPGGLVVTAGVQYVVGPASQPVGVLQDARPNRPRTSVTGPRRPTPRLGDRAQRSSTSPPHAFRYQRGEVVGGGLSDA